MELEYSGELAFQLHFSDYGEKCEIVGGTNVNWILLDRETGATNLQYKKYLRGLLCAC